jgi:hypothetical protein
MPLNLALWRRPAAVTVGFDREITSAALRLPKDFLQTRADLIRENPETKGPMLQ